MTHEIRDAKFSDVQRIARQIHDVGREKIPANLCLKRARQYIQWSRQRRKGHKCWALVTVRGDRGFVFAMERNAFDLSKTKFVEVHMLLGGSGVAVPLLQHLRARTHKRILVQGWSWFGRLNALERLLRPLRPEQVGSTYQI